MTYVLTAKGPGGEVTRTVTINENTQPTATLALSQPEIRYHKIGDKVVEQDSATLNWSTSNANSATLGALRQRRDERQPDDYARPPANPQGTRQ